MTTQKGNRVSAQSESLPRPSVAHAEGEEGKLGDAALRTQTASNVSGLAASAVREMSDEELRVKVAELCGWEKDQHFLGTIHWHQIVDGRLARCVGELPDYPRDLNACHETEKVMTEEQHVRFRLRLMFNSDGPKAVFQTVEAALCHATARQRAEAFLLTMSPAPQAATVEEEKEK